MVNAAYQVEVTVTTSSSVLRSLWEKMKQLVAAMPGRTPPIIDAEWKRKVAADMIASLSETKLTKSICAQVSWCFSFSSFLISGIFVYSYFFSFVVRGEIDCDCST